MKIVVIVGRYPPVFGGPTRPLRMLFSEMVNRGHEVVFLTPKYSASHPRYDKYNGIKVIRIPPGVNNSFTELLFAINSLKYVLGHQLHPQVIFDAIPYGMSMPFYQCYAKYKKISLVAQLSQVGTNEPSVAKLGRSGLVKRFFVKGYDFTFCISTALEKTCQLAGLEKKKYGIVFNCVDSDKFSPLNCEADVAKKQRELLPEAKKPIVIVPGSVSPRKRPHLALSAWNIIKKDYRLDGTLVFVGSLNSSGQTFNDNYASNILRDVYKYGVQDSVVFTGLKENIDEYFQISDLLLLVSDREGLPNVLLEGMSCGLPVVCTHIEGVTDDIFQDGVEGLYASGDPSDIARKLSILMKDDALRSNMSNLCIQRIRNKFNMENVVSETESILDKLITANSRERFN